MKITFHLDSSNPHDNIREARLILDSGAWKGVVEDLDTFLRGKTKYENLDAPVSEAFSTVREELHSLLRDSNLKTFIE